MDYIDLGDLKIAVDLKDIKNIHLSVYPPNGRIRIAAPKDLNIDTIRIFALSKLKWIKKQQASFNDQERETPREFLDRESHSFLGERYLLNIVEKNETPAVHLHPKKIELQVRPGSDSAKREEILEIWYRERLKELIPDLVSKWEVIIGVQSNAVNVRKMKTKWGTCNTETKRIWINLELVKKPVKCLEYIIVHELIHLLERKHNARFIAYMDRFLPQWRSHREELNRLPFSHINWKY